MADIRRLEELSLNAWPAATTLSYDGWLLRFAGGYTRRANSVQPLYPGRLDLAEKVANCEDAYDARGLPTVFKLTPVAQPDGLDAHLAALGYRAEALTGVRTRSLAELEPPDGDATLDAEISDDWLEAFASLSGLAPGHRPAARRLLASIPAPRRFASIRVDGETAAVGLVAVEGDFAGLFDIVTAPHRRNQGFGRRLVLHLLGWAGDQGAGHAYLQVQRGNAPALHLYERLGFREAYSYWYRARPPAPDRERPTDR